MDGGDSGRKVLMGSTTNQLRALDFAAVGGIARAILRKLRHEIIDALELVGSVDETVRALARSHRTCTFELDAQALPARATAM
jgi:hypothetical protein